MLANAGVKVAIAARRRDRLDELVDKIRAVGGVAEAITLDVGDAGGIPDAVKLAETLLGPVSILVNNAGMVHQAPAISQEVELIDRMIATNFRGPFILAREVARRLIELERPGSIVNIASIGAHVYTNIVPVALYAITKTAVLRMTEVLALEWAPNHINVNAISPGFFRSEMSEDMIEEMGDVLTASMPRKRYGEPNQLDSTLLYLVSPGAELVTGTCIIVDDAQMPR